MDRIKLSKCEIQSGLSRVRSAEGLILQLPKDHDGRNTWLMNYGVREEAVAIRDNDARVMEWDEDCDCMTSVSSTIPTRFKEERYFPIHRNSEPSTQSLRIPMAFMLQYEVGAQRNHDQSITRLAEQGGCTPTEIYSILVGDRWKGVQKNVGTDSIAAKLILDIMIKWNAGPKTITVKIPDNRIGVTDCTIEAIAAEADELGYAVIKPELTQEMKMGAAWAFYFGMDFTTLFKGLLKMGRVKPGGDGM